MLSFCMVAAQGVMLPIAVFVGATPSVRPPADLPRRLRRAADSRRALYALQ